MSAVVLRMISCMPALLAAVNRQDRDAERGPVQILAGPAAVPAEAVKMDQAWDLWLRQRVRDDQPAMNRRCIKAAISYIEDPHG